VHTAGGRFELSDKDKALFQEVREAVSNQGVQSQVQHDAMLTMFKNMEDRLHMQVRIEAPPAPSRGGKSALLDPCKWACAILWALRDTADTPSLGAAADSPWPHLPQWRVRPARRAVLAERVGAHTDPPAAPAGE